MRAFTAISLLSATASVSASVSPWSVIAFSDFQCQNLELGTSGRSDSTDCQIWGDSPVAAVSAITGDFEIFLYSDESCFGTGTGLVNNTTEKCLENEDGWRSYKVSRWLMMMAELTLADNPLGSICCLIEAVVEGTRDTQPQPCFMS